MTRVPPCQISATLLPGFEGTELPDWLAARLRAGLGGVCVFGPNITDAAQLRRLTDQIREANPQAIIAIDEEGGDVTRLHYATGSPFPGNAVLGRLDDTEVTARVAASVATDLRSVGCNLDFAPTIDVNSNPLNPVIGVRSFGADEELVARHGTAWITGLQSTGMAACAKHFPGHGDVDTDSHLALPVLDVDRETLRKRELVPFEAAVKAGVRAVMTSHILLPQIDPEHPATMSRIVLQELLREELGFDGLIVSDALDMAGASGELGIPEAAVRALAAGVDLLCIGTRNTDEQLAEIELAIASAVVEGRLDADRIVDAAKRVAAVAETLTVDEPKDITTEVSEEAIAETTRAFDIRVDDATLDAARAPAAIVSLDAVANIAVGVAPWGPFTVADPWPGVPIVGVDVGSQADESVEDAVARIAAAAGDGLLIVVGKGNHRHARSTQLVDALRAAGRAVLTVDMGWPDDARAYADIATFGASRLVGVALLELLGGEAS